MVFPLRNCFGRIEVRTMTEQQKITALYEKLPPDKKLEVTLMMRTLSAMMATLVTITTEKKGATK